MEIKIGDVVKIDDGFKTSEIEIKGFRDTYFGRKVYYSKTKYTDNGEYYSMFLYFLKNKIVTT